MPLQWGEPRHDLCAYIHHHQPHDPCDNPYQRARGFLEAAQLSTDWVREVGEQALILEAHHTTHIEGTRLTLDQAERLWKGEAVPEADPDDARELLNCRTAFEFVSEWVTSGGSLRQTRDRLTTQLATWLATDQP